MSNTPTTPDIFASAAGTAFSRFDREVFEGAGPLPRKERELIALAVALTTQCETCLKGHARAAVEHGATDEELTQVTFIAAALRAGGGVVHGVKALNSVRGLTAVAHAH